MIVARDKDTLHKVRDGLSGVVGVVMTMGALHDGHRALIEAARARCDAVLVTIFVNPLQFGPNEDLDRYPRPLDDDLALCERAGVDAVFAPTEAEMYPSWPPAVRVDPGSLGRELEGASRPGFFDGVLTVVLKLLHLTVPHAVFFGEKDYQQLALVRRMVRDLDVRTDGVPVRVVGVPTIREPNGLARSSRNSYLSGPDRAAALALSAALRAGAEAAIDGPEPALAAARAVLAAAPVEVDYLALTDPDLGPAPEAGPGRLLVAARVGGTRLIDNLHVELRPGHKPAAAQE
ncbi:pantothenate synthetase [Actinocatenispora thailandica]|uniref:Pantothenate synthetase n=1 Tax=Actinocatenispora thailandica TaxID=227318 RepID=A0A7R7I0K2_9ACTN|nr:pantoate--beta-alanine ligase [Actinocatenispora thailandica]BCJ38123.1 pantothenate synthetase [Actinocatenispora thailandica]